MTRPIIKLEQLIQEITKIPGNTDARRQWPYIVGFRGWDGKNNRGVYDDACFVVNDGTIVGSFNFNTDPSIFRPQIATLQEGVYDYEIGIHGLHHIDDQKPADNNALAWLYANVGKDHPNQEYRLTYWALRQAGPVKVWRDRAAGPETVVDRSGWPMTNIHRGGINSTSSEGCQTVEPTQWDEFRKLVYGLLGPVAGRKIKYILRVLPDK